MKNMGAVDWIAYILVVIGAVNWGLMGINASWNVVDMIFGFNATVLRVVYILVGLSGLWVLFKLFK